MNDPTHSLAPATSGPLVIYHAACSDGFASAYAAWLALGEDAQYLAMPHGRVETPADIENGLPAVAGREVWVLDFAFPRAVMEVLMARSRRLVWLDHHKSAFDDWCGPDYLTSSSKFEQVLHGGHQVLLDVSKGGGVLAWEHFRPGEPVPRLFAHIEDHDLGLMRLPVTDPVMRNLESLAPWTFKQWHELVPGLDLEDSLTGDETPFSQFVKEGLAQQRLHDAQVVDVLKHGVPVRLPLRRRSVKAVGLAVTCPLLLVNSVGPELARRAGSFALCWHVQGNGAVKCSLRSVGDFDVEALASRFGGGGHRHSAAFRTTLPKLMRWLQAAAPAS